MKKKRLFTNNVRGRGTVVLNWLGKPEGEFPLFAEAFHQTAKCAAAALRRDKTFSLDGVPQDFKAYPIVFLYRHALELGMKAVILAGGPMLELKGETPIDRDGLLRTHSLEALRSKVERVCAACGWTSWDLGVPQFKTRDDFRRVIAEFEAIDSGSYAFRYPIDTKGQPALASHFSFNLFEFCDVLDALLPALDSTAWGVREAARENGDWEG